MATSAKLDIEPDATTGGTPFESDDVSQSKDFKKLIIFGPPAAGKGTQAELLVQHFGLKHISTGDCLRKHVNEGTELGLEAKDHMDRGDLVPDALMVSIIAEEEKSANQGWLLDGMPRTESQIPILQQYGFTPDKVIILRVPESVLADRVTGRRIDPITNRSYHITLDPPPAGEVADRCIQRRDDTMEALQTRLEKYYASLNAIKVAYSDRLIDVDGDRSMQEVAAEIRIALQPKNAWWKRMCS